MLYGKGAGLLKHVMPWLEAQHVTKLAVFSGSQELRENITRIFFRVDMI